jgi:hypothetical protein
VISQGGVLILALVMLAFATASRAQETTGDLEGRVVDGTGLGGSPSKPPYYDFIRQGGTAGRTPSLWDLNLGASYTLPVPATSRWRPRLTLDVLHVGSPEKAANYDQVHYFNLDAGGNEIDPNPTYREPTAYQPAMAVRLGLEVSF